MAMLSPSQGQDHAWEAAVSTGSSVTYHESFQDPPRTLLHVPQEPHLQGRGGSIVAMRIGLSEVCNSQGSEILRPG